jgi:hypothetical protein
MRDPNVVGPMLQSMAQRPSPFGEIIAGFGQLIGIKTRRGKPIDMASTNTLERF